MKVVILAGGYGTRLSEETDIKPKPMVEIGGKPILWHIMKHYSQCGFNEFIILLGYKGYSIKEYFANYVLYQSNITMHLSNGKIEVHDNFSEPWVVTLLDTGIDTMTGGRIKRASDYIGGAPFLLTYGDGVSDVDVREVVQFHQQQKTLVTITAVQPEGRFGSLDITGHKVERFVEKPQGDGHWVNGGFMVCEPTVLEHIEGDASVFEQDALDKLAQSGQMAAFKHHGFWKCMDTLRDKQHLNAMWNANTAKWKTWD